MYLSGMELYGFKSFLQRTQISFDEHFNVIVGPNGCGKSNIVDAVRWVLGDQSPKALRLTNMDSVIFSGTQNLAPLNVAEVSLFFKGTNETLYDTFSEISITRRLFRSSTSEYFFNKKLVLLKELKSICANLGITSIAYSVISQGRVDKILESNPDERRLFLEEAAGIAPFLLRRQEALTKLERTKENLDVVFPSLKDKDKRLHELRAQMQSAKEYKSLLQQEKELHIVLALKQHSLLLQKQVALDERLAQEEVKMGVLNQNIEEKDKERSEIQDAINVLITQGREKEQKLLTVVNSSITQKELIGSIERQLIDNIEQRAMQEQVRLSYQESLKKLKDETKALEQSHRDEKTQQDVYTKKLQSIQKHIQKIQQRAQQIKRHSEECQASIETLNNTIIKKQDELKEALEALALEVDSTIGPSVDGEHAETLGDLQESQKALSDAVLCIRKVCKELQHRRADPVADDARFAKLLDALEHIETIKDGHIAQLYRCVTSLIRKTGPLALKRRLDTDIETLVRTREKKNEQRKHYHIESADLEEQEKLLTREYHQREYEKVKCEQNIQHTTDKIRDVSSQIRTIEEQYQVHNDGITRSDERNTQLRDEKNRRETLLKEYEDTQKKVERDIAQNSVAVARLEKKSKKIATSYDLLILKREGYRKEQSKLTLAVHEQKTKIELVLKNFYTNHSTHLLSHKDYGKSELYKQHSTPQLESKLLKVKQAIKSFGQVNLLAEEEHVTLEEECKSLQAQIHDIETARTDLFELLDRINEESRVILNKTLEHVNSKFSELFTLIFNGGRARLFFIGSDDPLSAGLEIEASPAKKKTKNLSMLSGGERTLLAIALLCALHSIKPAPVVLFDELDAPLDDQNVDRFIQLLYTFKSSCQFILVSHNKKTIAQGRKIVGITMQEAGVSSLLEVDISK